jgi:hypothetical protein
LIAVESKFPFLPFPNLKTETSPGLSPVLSPNLNLMLSQDSSLGLSPDLSGLPATALSSARNPRFQNCILMIRITTCPLLMKQATCGSVSLPISTNFPLSKSRWKTRPQMTTQTEECVVTAQMRNWQLEILKHQVI